MISLKRCGFTFYKLRMKHSLSSKSGKKQLKVTQRKGSNVYVMTMVWNIATISLMSCAGNLELKDIALVLTLLNRMGFQNV